MRQFVRRGQPFSIPGYEPWLSLLLHARGIDTPDAAEAFLRPSLSALHDPMLLSGMGQAVRLIKELGGRGARAVVYGDYDVDGICASAIAWDALTAAGLKTVVYIPNRHTEGYGINEEAVRQLAAQAELMLTVDCGITAVREAELARSLGLRLIITDHHRPPEVLPPADAVINPLLGDYPFPYLCGAGAAWKLGWALHGQEFASKQLDLAALATIADMVPLLDENRIIASFGLEAMRTTQRTGLRALMKVSGLEEGKAVSADRVSFGLAPRLNAGGRLATAKLGLDLLTSSRPQEAAELALQLDAINAQRRQEEQRVIEEARTQAAGMNLLRTHSLVVWGEGWNSGVVGLAAGKLAEAYGLPTLVLTLDGGKATGSGRTAGDLDLHAALSGCADLFDRFGGHKAAAGMSLDAAKLEALRSRFEEQIVLQLDGRPLLAQVSYDAELELSDITRANIEKLEQLAPFGIGNPSPAFLLKDVERLFARRVGADEKHLKLSLRKNAEVREGIAFGMGEKLEGMPPALNAVVRLSNNAFRGQVTPQFELVDYQAGERAFEENPGKEADTLLADFEAALKFGQRPAARLDPPGENFGPQGTLLLCRSFETACRMRALYPDFDVASGSYASPRGISAVLYNVPLEKIDAPCDRLCFCDGSAGALEAALAADRFPEAALCACPPSRQLRDLFTALRLSLDELREIYVQFRAGHGIMDVGRSRHRAMAAALIFMEIGLARLEQGRLELLPVKKADPRDSLVFQCLQQGV